MNDYLRCRLIEESESKICGINLSHDGFNYVKYEWVELSSGAECKKGLNLIEKVQLLL